MTPYWSDDHLTLYGGDCREVLARLPDESVNTVVTSPPYWGLRDYGVVGQLGLEPTPDEYVANMVAVFREVRRVLRSDGTLWLNLGDSYAAQRGGTTMPAETLAGGTGGRMADGSRVNRDRHDGYSPSRNASAIGLKHKDLVGIPWRVAFALQADGWYLRSDIIWAKPNPMPESVTDRPTKAHEYLFLLSKSARYFYDAEAVKEPLQSGPSDLRKMVAGQDRIGGLVKEQTDPLLRASANTNIGRRRSVGDKNAAKLALDHRMQRLHEAADDSESGALGGRNLRSVWTVATEPYPGAHFATFPRKLVEPCVKAGSPEGGVVLDPFAGSGTTLLVSQALGRRGVGIDLNPDYLKQAIERNRQMPLGLGGAA